MALPFLRHGRIAVPVVVGLVVALVVALAPSSTVAAQEDPPAELPPVAELAADGAAIEQLLAGVGLDAAWRSTVDLHPGARLGTVEYAAEAVDPVTALLATAFELDAVTRERQALVADMRSTAVALRTAREEERDRLIDRNRADAHFRGMHALTQAAAIQVFAGIDPAAEALLGLDGQALVTAQRGHALTNTTLDEVFSQRTRALADLEAAIEAHEAATSLRRQLERRHDELVADATELAQSRRELDDTARSMLSDAAAAFALAGVPRFPDLTPRALSAYLEAEVIMREQAPGCHVSWRTLAAIGAIEGSHGQYADRRLGPDGRPDEPIVGLRLDGVSVDNFGLTVANMPDTDGGRYDGDPRFDRAVGPMQFIPDTWSRWGRDADGDGERDPHDIDDAALAAGAYLCNYGSLRTWDVWSTAVFGYNHAAAYVNSVHGSLTTMQRLRLPEFEGDETLRPPQPYGVFVPLPEEPPEDEAIEGEAPVEGAAPVAAPAAG